MIPGWEGEQLLNTVVPALKHNCLLKALSLCLKLSSPQFERDPNHGQRLLQHLMMGVRQELTQIPVAVKALLN